MRYSAFSTGQALSQVLAGSWRAQPEPLEIAQSRLEPLVPLLVGSGAGALAWRRLRGSPASEFRCAEALRRAQMEQSLQGRLREKKIEEQVEKLGPHGIEPLLLKGLSCARLYPEEGLRPLGDIDLSVRAEHGAAASSALGVPVDSDEALESVVELRTGLRPIHGLSWDEAFAASQRIAVGRVHIRILGPEHHLRLLCLHFLRHGAWRPLWLCDIAAAIESRPPDFDWSLCLGPDKLRAGYVACTLGLAHGLLGANVEGTPAQNRARRAPPWLVPAVLREWATPMTRQHRARPLLSSVPRRPGPLLRAMMLRWPNPIEAALTLGAPLSLSPLPAQAVLFAHSAALFVRHGGDPRRARGLKARAAPSTSGTIESSE